MTPFPERDKTVPLVLRHTTQMIVCTPKLQIAIPSVIINTIGSTNGSLLGRMSKLPPMTRPVK